MSAYDYCRNKVALPGSSLYYSLLFVAPDLREALTALHALAEELREVADGSDDDGVTSGKLGWWAEELQRTCAGEPRHPVTRALTEPLHHSGIEADRFAGVLEAVGTHALRGGYGTAAEIEVSYAPMADITGCMAAEICGFANPRTAETSRGLGVGLALMAIVRAPRHHGARAVADLPLETLAGRARTHLTEYLDDMPREDHGAQRARRALAEMGLAQLGVMGRAGFAVRERPVAITPLRKLWIAWKHRR
jgi:phytoene synthase